MNNFSRVYKHARKKIANFGNLNLQPLKRFTEKKMFDICSHIVSELFSKKLVSYLN